MSRKEKCHFINSIYSSLVDTQFPITLPQVIHVVKVNLLGKMYNQIHFVLALALKYYKLFVVWTNIKSNCYQKGHHLINLNCFFSHTYLQLL